MKRLFILILAIIFILAACEKDTERDAPYMDDTLSSAERASLLLDEMTLEEKAGQMVQAERTAVSPSDIKDYHLGSVLSGGGSSPGGVNEWNEMVSEFQKASLETDKGIPLLYGVDAVHGHNNVLGATIFPHNIGIGHANDAELTREMGKVVALEMRQTQTIWNFGPCVALSMDERWGRNYESYSDDEKIVSSLAVAYAEGLMENGVIPTAKHYLGDGGTIYGTGLEGGLDRGNMEITDEELKSTHQEPYRNMVKSGVKVIMASFSSVNGVLMHENKTLLTDVLKIEMGFEGFIISDWEATDALSGSHFAEKVQIAVNSGIDMLMEPYKWKEARQAIIDGVNDGKIDLSRVNDAVYRILRVKFESGLFDSPYKTLEGELRGEAAVSIAQKLAEKSVNILKSDGLPIKEGSKVYLFGPGADDIGMQCGGWTLTWQGELGNIPGTSIKDGLRNLGYELAESADEADIAVMAIGEVPYAEWFGDIEKLDFSADTWHPKTLESIEEARGLDIPVVALVFAGRDFPLLELMEFDAVINAYLPGSEGQGVVNAITENGQQ